MSVHMYECVCTHMYMKTYILMKVLYMRVEGESEGRVKGILSAQYVQKKPLSSPRIPHLTTDLQQLTAALRPENTFVPNQRWST